MIGKQVRGRGIRGLLEYLFGPGKRNVPGRAQIVGGTMAGSNPRELSREFGAVRALRPDLLEGVVYHISFSCSEGERLTDEQWSEVGEAVAGSLRHDSWANLRHSDAPMDHAHYVGLSIRRDGTRAREHLREWRRVEYLCREIEQRFGLKAVQSPERGKGPHGRATRATRPGKNRETEQEVVTGELSKTATLEWRVRDALDGSTTSGEFLAALERHGVAAIANWKAGKVAGLTFADRSGWLAKGSTLKLPAAKIDKALNDTLSDNANQPAWAAHAARATAWRLLAKSTSESQEDDHEYATAVPVEGRAPGRIPISETHEPTLDRAAARGGRESGDDQDSLAGAGRGVARGARVRGVAGTKGPKGGQRDVEAPDGGPPTVSADGTLLRGNGEGNRGYPAALGPVGSAHEAGGPAAELFGPLEPWHDGAGKADPGRGGLGGPGDADLGGEAVAGATPGPGVGGPPISGAGDLVPAHGVGVGLPEAGVGIAGGAGDAVGTESAETAQADQVLTDLTDEVWDVITAPKGLLLPPKPERGVYENPSGGHQPKQTAPSQANPVPRTPPRGVG